MMDDLTPEEREALKNLPRERMPSAGLEDRVVGAMRHRGLLTAKRPGRVVRLTTGRVAGLLAACVVLVIGGYSIGLYRGDRERVMEQLQPSTETPATTAITKMDDGSPALSPSPQAEPPTALKKKSEAPATPAKHDRKVIESVPEEATELQRMSEERKELDWALKDADDTAPDRLATSGAATESAQEDVSAASNRSDQPEPPTPKTLSAEGVKAFSAPAQRQKTLTLGTTKLSIEAPDRVRIEEAPDDRMVTLTTTGAQIRIRPEETAARDGKVTEDQLSAVGSSTRSFQLGGSRFSIDAPEFVRIVEDADAASLVIYSADGPIRVRLAK